MARQLTISLVSATAVLFAAPAVMAQTAQKESPTPAPAPPAAPAGEADDASRLAWLEPEVDRIAASTETWYTGWTYTYLFLTGLQTAGGVVAPSYEDRVWNYVGAGSAGLAFIGMLTKPHSLVGAREALEKIDTSTPQGRYERRIRAEGLLRAGADEEAFEHSVLTHGLVIGATVITGLVALEAYDLKARGWVATGAALAIGELEIWSRGFRATNAWKKYVDRYHPASGGSMGFGTFEISLAVTPNGLVAQGTF